MKRIILLLLISLSLTCSLFASDGENTTATTIEVPSKITVEVATKQEGDSLSPKRNSAHLYLDSILLYGYPTLGGTFDIGVRYNTVTISMYFRYAHLSKPLGSKTGMLAIGEELGEIGMSFKVRTYSAGHFNVNIGINTGWYSQWLMLGSNAGTYNLVHNGLMIRPEGSIGWKITNWWNIELGLFYQTPLYPSYDSYNGWGVFVKLI